MSDSHSSNSMACYTRTFLTPHTMHSSSHSHTSCHDSHTDSSHHHCQVQPFLIHSPSKMQVFFFCRKIQKYIEFRCYSMKRAFFESLYQTSHLSSLNELRGRLLSNQSSQHAQINSELFSRKSIILDKCQSGSSLGWPICPSMPKEPIKTGLLILSDLFVGKYKDYQVSLVNNVQMYLTLLDNQALLLQQLISISNANNVYQLSTAFNNLVQNQTRSITRQRQLLVKGNNLLIILISKQQKLLSWSYGKISSWCTCQRMEEYKMGQLVQTLTSLLARKHRGVLKEVLVVLHRRYERGCKAEMIVDICNSTLSRRRRFNLKDGLGSIEDIARWRRYILLYLSERQHIFQFINKHTRKAIALMKICARRRVVKSRMSTLSRNKYFKELIIFCRQQKAVLLLAHAQQSLTQTYQMLKKEGWIYFKQRMQYMVRRYNRLLDFVILGRRMVAVLQLKRKSQGMHALTLYIKKIWATEKLDSLFRDVREAFSRHSMQAILEKSKQIPGLPIKNYLLATHPLLDPQTWRTRHLFIHQRAPSPHLSMYSMTHQHFHNNSSYTPEHELIGMMCFTNKYYNPSSQKSLLKQYQSRRVQTPISLNNSTPQLLDSYSIIQSVAQPPTIIHSAPSSQLPHIYPISYKSTPSFQSALEQHHRTISPIRATSQHYVSLQQQQGVYMKEVWEKKGQGKIQIQRGECQQKGQRLLINKSAKPKSKCPSLT